MTNPDLLLYVVHVCFWGSFGIVKSLAPAPAPATDSTRDAAPKAATEAVAPFSRAVLVLHSIAFGIMYFGVGNAVLPNRVPFWFPGQRIFGGLVITAGAALMSWALHYFRSWRFRAQLEAGHELATGGPFHYVRHPIYLGMNCLAVGTAIWVPTLTTWIGAVLMVLGGDLRGRVEEVLLRQVFGAAYTEYCARTQRFLPGVY